MAKKSLDAQALDVIAGIMNNPDASVSERLKAACIVLEHAGDKTDPAPKWARLDALKRELEQEAHHV